MGNSENVSEDIVVSDDDQVVDIPPTKKPVWFGFFRNEGRIPLFFLGLAAYRAWIEIVFVGSYIKFPTHAYAGHDLFDIVMVSLLFICAILSKKIGPFFCRKSIFAITCITMVAATICSFASVFLPEYAAYLALPAAVCGGIGVALIILLWSELYACLNPIRVALYYSASIACAALIIYLFRGLLTPWSFVIATILPVLSLACISKGFRSLPANELPRTIVSRFSFPWKPVVLMAVYAFAYGLREIEVYTTSSFGPHGAYGTFAVGVLIFLGVTIKGGKFDFGIIYRVALPLMVAAFLVLPSFGFLNQWMADFFLTASYTSFSILIMLIFANMGYRYGISAIWLFGIERGVRAIFSFFGRQASELTSAYGLTSGESGLVISALTILLVVAMTMILLSEKELSSEWGITFLDSGDEDENDVIIKKQELANRCSQTAKEYRLSQREEEVLLLLAQHKTVGAIERELFIANGTAKAHIRHIYRKLDIHSRDELFELLGL